MAMHSFRTNIPLVLLGLIGTSFAANCFGNSVGKPRGTFLGPINVREAVCGGQDTICGCHGQPNDDCMSIVTDADENKNFLFRREWMGGGEPNFVYCSAAFDNMMEQCIDSGIAEKGLWSYGQERYQIIWTNNVGDYQCTSDKGQLTQEVGKVGAIDSTIFNRVAQSVCGCKDGASCAREFNAGDNWIFEEHATAMTATILANMSK
ncbi:hypothetical protein EJ04DRAFT_549060 [Polyplosphaeria fusca]|uniref:Uncharacterized protein n=1 Tax=Polyplosphaeria fusca TaxID=682080 RepID=A0A9P4R6H9_9PLEO|nr:hypothetical protein EJ04DRAFT_549060 [Polyplosphaeria fusca]